MDKSNKIYKLLYVVGLVFVCSLFMGCHSGVKYAVNDRVIAFTPPQIHDTLYAAIIDSATIMDTSINASWKAYKVDSLGDTSIHLRVYPKLKKVQVDIKLPTQSVTVHDTVPIPKPEIKYVQTPRSFAAKLGEGVISFSIGVGIVIIILIIIRKKI